MFTMKYVSMYVQEGKIRFNKKVVIFILSTFQERNIIQNDLVKMENTQIMWLGNP